MVTNFADSFSALWTDVTFQQVDPVLVNFQVVFFCKGLATLVTNMFLLGAMNLVNVSVEALVPEDDVDHGDDGGDDDGGSDDGDESCEHECGDSCTSRRKGDTSPSCSGGRICGAVLPGTSK